MKKRHSLRVAVYLILKSKKGYFLQRRYNTGWMDGCFSLIAGHLEAGETIVDTVIREAYEEAGIKLCREDLVPAHTLQRRSVDYEYIDFFFVATNWENEPQITEPDKCDLVGWFPQESLPSNLVEYVAHVLEQIELGVPFSIYGWD